MSSAAVMIGTLNINKDCNIPDLNSIFFKWYPLFLELQFSNASSHKNDMNFIAVYEGTE